MKDTTQAFIIFGRVFDPADNQGIAGLTVEALDKDLLFDDRLGSATTNAEGQFQIQYDRADFQDLFFEAKPDIYLQVRNVQGEIIHTTIDKIRHASASVEEFSIAIPKQEAYSASLEHPRRYFKQSIAINPNYFGTASKQTATGELAFNPVFPLSRNTKYEELRCVGLYPEEDLLEAIIEVKLPYGFNVNYDPEHRHLCNKGSKEYVAFYIDNGTGWVSAGAPTQVSVRDLKAVNKNHLFYAVRRAFVPQQILNCFEPQILKVRAILSWEDIPTGPNFIPVWGNIKEIWVQIRPKYPVFMLADRIFPPPAIDWPELLDGVEPFPEEMPTALPVSLPKPQFVVSGDLDSIRETVERTIQGIEEEKQSGQVENARLEFSALIEENPNYFGSISAATNPEILAEDIAKLPPPTIQYLATQYSLDPSLLQPILPQNPKTKYEELTCVGLYPEEDLLEATIALKQPYGYNGDLCTLGSWEHVVFFIKWGARWEYVGQTRVRVHNIPAAQDRVLHYAVKVRIEDETIKNKLKPCQRENIVKVRALLSWNYLPPFIHKDPNWLPAWGNVLERHIQIRPKTGASILCDLEIVNDIHVANIAQSGPQRGYAYNPDDTVPPLDYNRPFGGVIAAWGNVKIPGAAYYRFRFKADNDSAWSTVLDKRMALNPSSWFPVIGRQPDGDGWFSIKEYQIDRGNYLLTPLIHWRSNGKNGTYQLKLELANDTKIPLPGQVAEVAIVLDNTSIAFYSFVNTPENLPASGVTVKDSAGNFKKCDEFVGTEPIKVYGNFRDDHFANFAVYIAGGNIIGKHPLTKTSTHIDIYGTQNAGNGTDGQEISSFTLYDVPQSPTVKCAYAIVLHVSDRAIVGRVRGYEFNTTRHSRKGYVTFNWSPM